MHVQLSIKLEEEFQQRKSAAKGGPVPAMVSGLTVRAVNITRKETEVKPKYYEAFHQTHAYPQRFPFTQKVILVFQQIEGVDVLIFVVYVQVSAPPSVHPCACQALIHVNLSACWLARLASAVCDKSGSDS